MPKFSAYMKGNDGSVGPPGSSIINGIVSTTNDLPRGGGNKIAYLVGVSNPKKLYVWNASTGEWEDQGTTANKLGAVTASITTTPTGYPSVKVTHSTSNQEDKINFSFTIPDANDAKVNRDGDTMTGGLNIASISTPLSILKDGDKVISFKAADGTKQADLFVTESNHRFGFRSFNQHSHPDVFLLPVVDSALTTTTSINYNILTSKNLVTVAQGGTGLDTHTTNAVLVGNDTNAVKNIASKSGAFYATTTNGAPVFGTLPVGQGGTGITANPSMLVNLGSTLAASVFASTPRPGVTGVLTVASGGTGLDAHTINAVLVGNGANDIKNIASKSGAFYAITANGAPTFGTLPIAQGGTGASTAVNARKAFFGSNLNTTAERLIAISGSYADGGYVSLPLSIDLGGTGATSASTALMNLGAVNKTGDTMTGVLKSTSFIQLIDTGMNIGVTPSNNDIWGRPLSFSDKNENITGQIRMIYRKSSTNQLYLSSINQIEGTTTTVNNVLTLGVDTNGTRSVGVSDKQAWRDALGASNGIWPTSIGGTGGTDSTWQTIVLSSSTVASGTLQYRKVGVFVEIMGYDIKLVKEVTGRSVNLAEIPSIIKPNRKDHRILLNGTILRPENTVNTYDPVHIEIFQESKLNLARPSWITKIETTHSILLRGMYFIG